MITWVAKNLIVSVLLNRSGVPIQSLGMGDLCWVTIWNFALFCIKKSLHKKVYYTKKSTVTFQLFSWKRFDHMLLVWWKIFTSNWIVLPFSLKFVNSLVNASSFDVWQRRSPNTYIHIGEQNFVCMKVCFPKLHLFSNFQLYSN